MLATLAIVALYGIWNRVAGNASASFEAYHACTAPSFLGALRASGSGPAGPLAWERLLPRQASIQSILESEKQLTAAAKLSSRGLHIMYGTFLVPFMQTHPAPSLLTVGTGCNPGTSPDASIALWRKLFPMASLWEANFDATCVKESPKSAHFLRAAADQSKQATLQTWLQSIPGDLHVIIHDHSAQDIPTETMFNSLWPVLRPGGMYFMEIADGNAGMSTNIERWIEKLLIHVPGDSNGLPSGIESVYCQPKACMVRKQVCYHEVDSSGSFVAHTIRSFDTAARRMPQDIDKVTTHRYQVMYGTFLFPFMQAHPQAKMLEIGLGCGMSTGPSGSIKMWRKLFPSSEIWVAEWMEKCLKAEVRAGHLEGINTLTGDQGDATIVQEWVVASGGNFDVIIDDGSHRNKHIKVTFDTLWPALRSGGLYFIEDLQVGREPEYANGPATSEIMQAWVHDMLTSNAGGRFPLPADIESVFCQWEACVVRKTGSF